MLLLFCIIISLVWTPEDFENPLFASVRNSSVSLVQTDGQEGFIAVPQRETERERERGREGESGREGGREASIL